MINMFSQFAEPFTDRDHKCIYEALVKYASVKHGRRFAVRYKSKSLLMRLLAFIVYLFNREFMSRYITVIGKKVYYPSRVYVANNYERAWIALAHELVHMADSDRVFGFSFLYLFPASLVVPFEALCFASGWPFWAHIFSVLFLLPLPAPFRAHFELRGYAMNMAIDYWRYGKVSQTMQSFVWSRFTGSGYYYMWPFKKRMGRRVSKSLQEIEDCYILQSAKNAVFNDVRNILLGQTVNAEKVIGHA